MNTKAQDLGVGRSVPPPNLLEQLCQTKCFVQGMEVLGTGSILGNDLVQWAVVSSSQIRSSSLTLLDMVRMERRETTAGQCREEPQRDSPVEKNVQLLR